ncbi:MAG TPA: glycosyltransferase [Gemmataceae bacterium]
MLPKVTFGPHCCSRSTNLDNYRPFVGDELIDEVRRLAAELKGVRVCQVNATASGGGVAELLDREVPLYRALGIPTDWQIIHGDREFFTVTKGFHNALQGGEFRVTATVAEEYLEHNRLSAEMLGGGYDVYVIHDPQPAALRHFWGDGGGKWVWRCHIDSSEPNPEVWQFLRPYVEEYDAAVFTMERFRPPDLRMGRVAFIPPAIDPLATKNMDLPYDLCREVIADEGLDLDRPILLQVSRFDPWKDPLGVIEAFRLVREKRPGVQLALVGAMAGDDPEGWAILETIQGEAARDPDISVFTNMTGVGNMEVNAFQRGCDLVIQKSIREGFGLVVSEALWKAKPVVAGRAGGIPMQFPDGYEENLVRDVRGCADRLLYLLENPEAAAAFGRAGKEKVSRDFLLPRLIRDELRLLRELLRA